MARQNPGSKLKKQDNGKPVKGQSIGRLVKERGPNNEDMGPASGLNGTLNNKHSQPDKFDIFRGQLPPFTEVYRSIEFACVAARHGSEWILISGKAVLSTEPCTSEAQIKPLFPPLHEIVALQGRIPAGGYKKLVADLRESWAVRDPKRISVRLTAKGAGGYRWWKPHVIKSRNPSSLWGRALALDGDGPDPSSFLSDSIMNKIDSQLHSSTSAFNGFDGLCRELGLPARRSNLALSFQLSAELPAKISSVDGEGSKWALKIAFNCLGAPDLAVEWWPKLELERIPATRWRGPVNDTYRVSCPVAGGTVYAADLILSFGELQADVAIIELKPLHTGEYSDGEPFSFSVSHQVPKDDEDIAEHRKNQELVKSEVDSALAGPQKLTKARFEFLLSTLRSPARKAIMQDLYDHPGHVSARDVCLHLDAKGKVELPARWNKNGKYRLFAQDAYDRDDEIRQNIESEVYKMRELLSRWRAEAGR